MVSKDWLAGGRVTWVTAGGGNCSSEYAGNLGTPYRDWHTTPEKVPAPLYRAGTECCRVGALQTASRFARG